MEENLERGPIIPQPSSDECIIAAKVYGKCRQQDCLRPDFIEPEPGVDSIPITGSLSAETVNIVSIGGTILPTPIAPNSPIVFPLNLVKYGRVIGGVVKITSMQITTEQEQNLLSADGYWKVTIRYHFNYRLELIGAAGTVLPIQLEGVPTTQNYICAYSIYEKQIVLFGGAGNPNIYVASNLFANNGPYTYQNAPYVAVQAKATPLAVSIGTYVDPCPVDPTACPENIIGVTIGLFTIIKLFRLVTMNVRTSGNCDIPLCDPILPGDPCSFFNELPFPFDDFDPPTS
jgi:hypothetical protein